MARKSRAAKAATTQANEQAAQAGSKPPEPSSAPPAAHAASGASSTAGDGAADAEERIDIDAEIESAAAAEAARFGDELKRFWGGLSVQQRGELMRVGRQQLFQQIRQQYCCRCYGSFQQRYDELRR